MLWAIIQGSILMIITLMQSQTSCNIMVPVFVQGRRNLNCTDGLFSLSMKIIEREMAGWRPGVVSSI